MENDKIRELLNARALAEQQLEKMRSRVTLLFSDIKGSTAYFEKKGDVEGLAMVQRHNSLLTPVIARSGGRVVKTIGDSIMACFQDPVGAIRAAIGMQQALEEDRRGRSGEEQIHVRIGLHTGLGLIKDNDVFGDVVNAAARIQRQAEPGQILITEALVEAAATAGARCVRIGRAEMKGKDETFDVFAVAWSAEGGDKLLDELQTQFDRKLRDERRAREQAEEELEKAHEEWRAERRRLNGEIERLEENAENARKSVRQQVAKDLQAEVRFALEEAVRARQKVEQDFAAAQAKWESDQARLTAQIGSMQSTSIELMEQRNNPARMAVAVRDQVEVRLREAREAWQLEWESERRRLNAEIDRHKKAGSDDERKQAARRALLEKLGKIPPGAQQATKTAAQWESEFQDAKLSWEAERGQLSLRAERAERALAESQDGARNTVFHEMRAEYEPRIQEANSARERVQQELDGLKTQFEEERTRLTARIVEMEKAIPEAQESGRRQVTAELKADLESKAEELNRMRTRAERRLQDEMEEAEAERRRLRKQIAQLEEQLKEARSSVFKAQRAASGQTSGT